MCKKQCLCSKDYDFTVLYKASVKQKINDMYDKFEIKKNLTAKMHCIGILHCLDHCFDKIPGVFICSDGFGSGGVLHHHLKIMLKEKYDPERIIIYTSLRKIFTKRNSADRLARQINRIGDKPSLVLTEKHFEPYFHIKKKQKKRKRKRKKR